MTSLGRQSDTVHTSLLYRGLAAVLTQPLLTWLTHLDVNCSLVALTGLWDLQCDMDLPLRDTCLLYTSPSPRDATLSRMPSSA